MPVVERTRPDAALAARQSLRAQIARLDEELARIVASTYPPVAPPGLGRDPRRLLCARPRLIGLAELEQVRDHLAGLLTDAHRELEEQATRQAEARALLASMYADPERHKGAVLTNEDLGLPGCTTYRVVPRLFSRWWRVKVSSGCPLRSRPA